MAYETGNDWTERENAVIAKMRAELAAEREQEQTVADHEKFAAFAARKAEAARKACDQDRAEVWSQASSNARKGLWTVHRIIASDPEIVAFQGMRTALLYKGATKVS